MDQRHSTIARQLTVWYVCPAGVKAEAETPPHGRGHCSTTLASLDAYK